MNDLPTREQFLAASEKYLGALIAAGCDNSDRDLLMLRAKIEAGTAMFSFQQVAEIINAPLDVVVSQFESWVEHVSGKRVTQEGPPH